MLSIFNRSIPPDVAAELDRLRKLEQQYGPVVNLSARIDQLTSDFLALCDKYEEEAKRLGTLSRIVDLSAHELKLTREIEALEAAAQSKRTDLQKDYDKLKAEIQATEERLAVYSPLIKATELQQKLQTDLAQLNNEIAMKRDELKELSVAVEVGKATQELREMGFYEPVFNFADSATYEQSILANIAKQKAMAVSGEACVCRTKWSVEGNERAGAAIAKNTISLVLRAFNNECEVLISRTSWRNFESTKRQIEKSFKRINSFVAAHKIDITEPYLALKLEQLTLTFEQAQKIKEEKEALRRERELTRENERAEREYQQAIVKAEEEEARYQRALEKARQELGHNDSAKLREQIGDLEAKLERAMAERERAKSMAQMTRSGYVYVISNIGSFGEKVFKVGMTRRLDPMDRVHELGDASVPFSFDVHAMIWTEDAPGLENELHRRLDQHRVNRINYRKEFFNAEMETVRAIVLDAAPNATFVEQADAEQYHASLRHLMELDADRDAA